MHCNIRTTIRQVALAIGSGIADIQALRCSDERTRNIRKLLQEMALRIKALRRSAGLTQEQLSEKADIATQYLSRLENAHQVPSIYIVVDLAGALNTTPSALLGDLRQGPRVDRADRLSAMLGTLTEEDAEIPRI